MHVPTETRAPAVKWYRAGDSMAPSRPRLVTLLVSVVCAHLVAQQAPANASISWTPQSIVPGDVVRIDLLEGGAATTSVMFLGKSVPLDYDSRRNVWSALVGIDLDTKPGAYSVRAGSAVRTLRVRPKQFRIRRLTVPADFVDPPAGALEQIARDNKKTAEIFASRTAKRWSGAFLLPVDGQPSSNFGTRSYYNGVRRSPHAGIDFAGGPGTPIRASNHGVIVLAEPLYLTGNTVIVDYGSGLFSLFAHLSELRVQPGDVVAPDTIVGLVGATGRVTGPHLHWSVRLNGARVDPLSLVAATK